MRTTLNNLCVSNTTYFKWDLTYLRHVIFVNVSEGTDSIFVMHVRYGRPIFTGIAFIQCLMGSNQALFEASVSSILQCIACSYDVISLIEYIYADLMNWISINKKYSQTSCMSYSFLSNSFWPNYYDNIMNILR